SCGLPLVAGWGAFLFALVPLAAALSGKAKLFHPAAVFIPGVVLCLAVIAGLAGIGNFLSVLLPSRWAACVLTYLAGVVLMLLPYFTLFPWYQMVTRPKTPQLIYQVLYLVPFEGLAQLGTANPAGYWTDHPAMLLGPRVPIWIV